jgi:hypothetical protein
MTKQCSICKKNKNESEFYPQSRYSDYLRSECKKCSRKASHRYYELHREKVLQTAHQRYARKRKLTAKT